MRNCSHIKTRSSDIPQLHASFLQRNSVLLGATSTNNTSKVENLVISGMKLAEKSTKTVLSEPHTKSLKQTNASQVLVSETVPDRRIKPSREAKKTRFSDNPVTSTVAIPPRRQPRSDTSTRNRRNFKLDVCDPDLLIPIEQTRVNERHSKDLREPQPIPSDSHPASLQPVSETTTSESSMSLPSSPSLEAHVQRAPVPVAAQHHHQTPLQRAVHSHLQMLRAPKQQHQPVHQDLLHGLFKSICRSGVNPEKVLRIRRGAMQVYHHNQ